MADKEYEVKIGTKADTSGAKEAEAALDGVSTAAKSAEEAITGSGGNPMAMPPWMLGPERIDEVTEATGELEAGLEAIRDKLEEVVDESEAANEQTSELDENVKQISRAQKAQALATIAQEVGKIAGRFREAAKEVEQFDAAAAASMRQTADRIEQVTGAVSTLALGFAVGGPLGLGVAALAVGVNALLDAFQAAEVAAIKSAAAQTKAMREAAAATREAAAAEKQREAIFASGSAITTLEKELEGLQAYTQELSRQLTILREKRRLQNEVLEEQDRLDLARIDEAEAKGDLTPAQAANQRDAVTVSAQNRADQERKQVAREDARLALVTAQARTAELATAANSAANLEAELEKYQSLARKLQEAATKHADFMRDVGGGNDQDAALAAQYASELETYRVQIEAFDGAATRARAELDAARKAAQDAVRDADVATDRAGAVATTVDAVAQRRNAARESRSRTTQARAANQERERAEREAAREQERIAREQARTAAQDARNNLPRAIAGALGGANNTRAVQSVNAATEALRDGASADELSGLGDALESLVDTISSSNAGKRNEIKQIIQRVANLEERIRRNPPQ